jgi:hypothetical protein
VEALPFDGAQRLTPLSLAPTLGNNAGMSFDSGHCFSSTTAFARGLPLCLLLLP